MRHMPAGQRKNPPPSRRPQPRNRRSPRTPMQNLQLDRHRPLLDNHALPSHRIPHQPTSPNSAPTRASHRKGLGRLRRRTRGRLPARMRKAHRMTTAVQTCAHPDCTRDRGNPAPTPLGICEPCQRRVQRRLNQLAADWLLLHHMLPEPLKGDKTRTAKHRDYGHPAEWASDMAADIATALNDVHDNLAETRNETPPPPPTSSEKTRIKAAYRYLAARIPALCQTDYAADTINDWNRLHTKVRHHLGQTRPRIAMAAPCPECNMRTLIRNIDVRQDWVECGTCQLVITEDLYRFYAQVLLDEILTDTPPEQQ